MVPVRWRVYTENTPTIRDLVARLVEGATLYVADGLWRGTWEHSLIVELIGVREEMVRRLADSIKATGQEAVLVTREPLEVAQMI